MTDRPFGGINETDLHAYVDGELSAERATDVERWLAENPADAARVRAWRTANRAIGTLHAEVLNLPVPARLNPAVIAAGHRRRLLRMAAGVLLFMAGIGTGWMGNRLLAGSPAEQDLASRAISAHRVYTVEVRHAVEVAAADETHLISWLSKRLDHELRAPDLTASGFKLVGGRMLPNNGKPAAQFMYEDGGGRRLTMYVARCQPNVVTAFRYQRQEGVGAFYWMDGAVGYAVIGEGEREALYTLASVVYEQLER